MANQSLEYGKRRGDDTYEVAYPIGASEVFKKKGGAFLKDDSSGRLEVATATDQNIIGHLADFAEDFTASSTEGATILKVNTDLQAHYELPINTGTWAATMRGKTCDLSVSSSIQGLNLSASSVDIVELIEVGTTNPAGTVVSAVCKLYINNLTRNGVA